jgi:hypothetical protein
LIENDFIVNMYIKFASWVAEKKNSEKRGFTINLSDNTFGEIYLCSFNCIDSKQKPPPSISHNLMMVIKTCNHNIEAHMPVEESVNSYKFSQRFSDLSVVNLLA